MKLWLTKRQLISKINQIAGSELTAPCSPVPPWLHQVSPLHMSLDVTCHFTSHSLGGRSSKAKPTTYPKSWRWLCSHSTLMLQIWGLLLQLPRKWWQKMGPTRETTLPWSERTMGWYGKGWKRSDVRKIDGSDLHFFSHQPPESWKGIPCWIYKTRSCLTNIFQRPTVLPIGFRRLRMCCKPYHKMLWDLSNHIWHLTLL